MGTQAVPANHGLLRAAQLPTNCDKLQAINHTKDTSSVICTLTVTLSLVRDSLESPR